MKKWLLLLALLFLLPFAYGFSVTIDSPSSNAVLNGDAEIQVTLSFSGDANGNASAVHFYYKNFSEDYHALSVNSTSGFTKYSYSFNSSMLEDTLSGSITVIAVNITGENVSASTSVKVNNVRPTSTDIPDVIWPEDEAYSSLNLTQYFSDTEKRNKFSYSASSVDDIEISINSDTGIVTLTPDANFSGIREVIFTASDGTFSVTSNEVTLNVTDENDAPIFIGPIQNRSWIKNTKMVIKVNESFMDIDNDNLTYTYSIAGGHVEIAMSENGTAVLTPAQDFVGNDSVVFKASDGAESAYSNKVMLEITGTSENREPAFDTADPLGGDVELKKGESKTFKITKSDPDGDSVSVKWYVDGSSVKDDSDSYEFKADNIGNFTLKVEISDSAKTVSRSWKIIVGAGLGQAGGNLTSESSCGNNAIDAGEDCENCAADIKCGDGEKCKDKVCVKKEGIGYEVLIIAILVLAGCIAYGYFFWYRKSGMGYSGGNSSILIKHDKKNGRDEMPATEISDFYFLRKDEKPHRVKDINIDSLKRTRKLSRVDEALLRSYIKMALQKGTPEEKMKKSLLSQGFSIEQIEKTLKELR